MVERFGSVLVNGFLFTGATEEAHSESGRGMRQLLHENVSTTMTDRCITSNRIATNQMELNYIHNWVSKSKLYR